jgi:hypothetical protein
MSVGTDVVASPVAIAEIRTWDTLLLDEELHLGESMKKEWQVRHAVVECSDGQRRWDYTYQFLLRWMMEQQTAGQQPPVLPSQENDHENRPLCPSIDQPSNAKSKH